ncbi:HNH endonuclease [Ensifer sp. ENS04]|uniref:HNH endonuclease signature motif containing protein n=1 Tax=Ensifer sp. ENS04 TaxID=2769281 RepID=UPI00177BF80F|nr:HNH endonuclease signature motif containing protein [Ensifer sp. ENS04]MBD9542914.1 HNH endonuclease [Ensifer sp. ENS04]
MDAANDNDKLPRTLAEAKQAGETRYFTGKPCKHGHVAPRITSNRRCSECSRLARSKWGEENEAHVKEYRKRYYAQNSEEILSNWADWYEENREEQLKKKSARYHENRDDALTYAAQYRAEHPDKVKASSAKWRAENPDKQKAGWDRWYAENGKERDAKRRSTPRGKIDDAISSGIYRSIRSAKGGKRWETLTGYSLDDLMSHLEKKFLPGMTWENYGFYGWHIDHKIPKAAFNYSSPDHIDFKRCWALENLQPLWAEDNIRKHARLEEPFQPSLAITA